MTADVVGLYPSVPPKVDLRALIEPLDRKDKKSIPKEESLKIAESVFKNNYFK